MPNWLKTFYYLIMDYNNKPLGYYNNDRLEMLKYLPKNTFMILDIGCSDGSFGKMVKDETQSKVWGIEYRKEEANKAEFILDKIYTGPCEQFIEELHEDYFDAIYFNDILENLEDPYKVLKRVKSKLTKNGVVISSISNIRHYKAILKLINMKPTVLWTKHTSGFSRGKVLKECMRTRDTMSSYMRALTNPVLYAHFFLISHFSLHKWISVIFNSQQLRANS